MSVPRTSWWPGWVALAFAGAWFASARFPGGGPSQAATPVTPTPAEAAPSAPRLPHAPPSMGCASANCHGAAIPDDAAERPNDAWKWAATVWASDDRHALAWRVLETPQSRGIMRRLYRVDEEDGLIDERGKSVPEAPQNPRCVACHSDPALAHEKANVVESARRSGVACLACHGQADGWLVQHLTWNPKTERPGVYRASGMNWLNDLHVRAETCAGCHVGAPASADSPPAADAAGRSKSIVSSRAVRDVDHDLIAAGHPALNFEFSSYQRRMPKHWRERDRVKNLPRTDFESTSWSIGQTETLRAELALHESRRNAGAAFTDFSELNCYDCHHALSAGGRKTPWSGSERGKIGWRRRTELARLDPMGRFLPAKPFTLLNQVQLQGLRKELDQQALPATRASILDWFSDRRISASSLTWFEADAVFRALASAESDAIAPDKPPAEDTEDVLAKFNNVASHLRTIAVGNDPRVWIHTPPDFDPNELERLFHELIAAMKGP